MNKTTVGILAFSLSLGARAEEPNEKITVWDIPQVCQDFLMRDSSFATEYTSAKTIVQYTITDASSTVNREGVPTNSYERRIWKEPRPSFADSLRLECKWTEGGNISYTYEEPSPINRSANYYGQDSYIYSTYLFSSDGKTLLEEEIVERDFGQPYLFPLTDELRNGKYYVENKKSEEYVTGKVASEITDTNPETGALIVEYARKVPSKGRIKWFVASRYIKTENGLEYRVLERFQQNKEQKDILTPENFHLLYATDARGNVVHIEKDTYDFSESSADVYHLEKTASIVQDATYTTTIKFEGHNIFDERTIVHKNPQTEACLSQVHLKYHYDLGAFERPIYWMDVTKIPCPNEKPKKKQQEPETIVTKSKIVTRDILPELSATEEIHQALIFPGELMAWY